MNKTVLISLRVSQDTALPQLTDVSSFTVSNYGATALYLKVNELERVIPAFNPDYLVPVGGFTMDGDGTLSDIRLEFRFDTGVGNAIIDYRKLKDELKNNNICTV